MVKISKDDLLYAIDNCISWLDNSPEKFDDEKSLRKDALEEYLILAKLVPVSSAKEAAEYLLDGKEYVKKTFTNFEKVDGEYIDYMLYAPDAPIFASFMKYADKGKLEKVLHVSRHSANFELQMKLIPKASSQVTFLVAARSSKESENDKSLEIRKHTVKLYLPDDEIKINRPSIKKLQSLNGFQYDMRFKYAEAYQNIFIDDILDPDISPLRDIPAEKLSSLASNMLYNVKIPENDKKDLENLLIKKIKNAFFEKKIEDYHSIGIYHPSTGSPVVNSGLNCIMQIHDNGGINGLYTDNLQEVVLFKELIEKLM